MKIKTYKFTTKAENLRRLSKLLGNKINIPKFIFFTKKEFVHNKKKKLKEIINFFKNKKIIIRSAALDEDIKNKSNAGKYSSFIILKNQYNYLVDRIENLVKEFKNENDQILVQEYISKPEMCGVIFTSDIETNAPYYTINFDKSGKTNLITSGLKNKTEKTLIIYKKLINIPKNFSKLINIIKQIEKITNNTSLDIEFLIKNSKVFILQLRPLKNTKKINLYNFDKAINNISKKISKYKNNFSNLHGNETLFSNMCDWNPAEIIGAKSKRLSISLYQELVTDNSWAIQRKNYFYKNVEPNTLMVDFGGCPYIDMRVDFNSFIPNNLPDTISKKIINFYLRRVKKNPELHDKIEFDVIPTCFFLNDNFFLKKVLTENEIKIYKNHLKNITIKIFHKKGPFFEDYKKIKEIENRIFKIKFNKKNHIQNIFYLVNECKKNGIIPFAGLARSAFITTFLLKEFEKLDLISSDEMQLFYKSIKSFTKIFSNDLKKILLKKENKKMFIYKYGHLRPSTYSISSLNYREGFDKYFKKFSTPIILKNKINKFKIFKNKVKIDNLLKKNNTGLNFKKLLIFSEKTIFLREYSKYIFTKYIDLIFKNLIELGKETGIKRSDLEYISIKTILNAHNNLNVNKLSDILKDEIFKSKKQFKITRAIKLPEVIKSNKDVYYYFSINKLGNYITNQIIVGEVALLKNFNNKNINQTLDNKIIFIENADPGFDFIFNYNILGLITMYGGTNSHMAIRCSELNIPAVIGVGEKKYYEYANSKIIEINCQIKTIKNIN